MYSHYSLILRRTLFYLKNYDWKILNAYIQNVLINERNLEFSREKDHLHNYNLRDKKRE